MTEPTMQGKRWAANAAALIAGAALPLAFAPFGIWPLAILSPAVLFLLWYRATARQAAWLGWLFGVGMWGTGVYWIYHSLHYFGAAIAPLAAVLTGLFAMGLALTLAIAGALIARGDPAQRGPLWLLVLAPAAWVLWEWVRSWLLTGFPWLLLGTAHTDTWLAGYAPVIGVYGISLIAAITAGAIAWGMWRAWCHPRVVGRIRGPKARESGRNQCRPDPSTEVGRTRAQRESGTRMPDSRTCGARIRPTSGPAYLIIAGFVITIWAAGAFLERDWTTPDGEPFRAAIVQGSVAQELKFASYRPSLERYVDNTRPLAGEAELVLWPETAVPTGYHRVAGPLDNLAAEMRAAGTDVVTGIFTRTEDARQYYNSIRPLGPDEPAYHKQHLVPFGEYLPLRLLLQPVERFIEIPMTDLATGSADQTPLTAAGTRLGGLVCYEAAYPAINRNIARDAGVIVNVSNDAWFGDSTAPAQHLQMARMRAMEVQRPMLRATNTGISAFIDHRGRIIEQGPQFEVITLHATVQPRNGLTPYHRWGEWPVWLGLALLIGIGLLGRRTLAPSALGSGLRDQSSVDVDPTRKM